MPINNDLSNLPRTGGEQGALPSRNNFVVERLAQAWYDAYLDEYKPAIPEAGPFTGSMAGSRCDRALHYKIAGVDPSNPPGIADVWRMNIGQMVHEAVQAVTTEVFKDHEDFDDPAAEVVVDYRPIGVPGSAHLDYSFRYKRKLTAVELKTINGFGFKMIATNFKGPAQGPRFGAIMQGALSAEAIGAEQLVIGYLSLENLSPQMASSFSDTEAGRFVAEWHYTIEELRPWLAVEKQRIADIIANVENDILSPTTIVDPEYPEGARISPAGSGMWVVTEDDDPRIVRDSGSTWFCDYCWHRDQCKSDG
jgi:hypothetical protein